MDAIDKNIAINRRPIDLSAMESRNEQTIPLNSVDTNFRESSIPTESVVVKANELVMNQVRSALEIVASKESARPGSKKYIENLSALVLMGIEFSQGTEENLSPEKLFSMIDELAKKWDPAKSSE